MIYSFFTGRLRTTKTWAKGSKQAGERENWGLQLLVAPHSKDSGNEQCRTDFWAEQGFAMMCASKKRRTNRNRELGPVGTPSQVLRQIHQANTLAGRFPLLGLLPNDTFEASRL